MTDPANLSSRVTELEIQLAHVQHSYDKLNEVVTEQSTLIDRLGRKLKSLENELKQVKQRPETASDPLDEKPPHY